MIIKQNIFAAIPEDLKDEFFEALVIHANLKIERIVSKGHRSPAVGWYDQQQNEWVIVLSGEAEIVFEGEGTYHLKQGDYVNIPSHKKHKVIWTSPALETVWLAIHY